jgi:hypothetical protein
MFGQERFGNRRTDPMGVLGGSKGVAKGNERGPALDIVETHREGSEA